MNIINGWQGLSMAHGDMTGIKSFKYCPYCGKILEEEKNNIYIGTLISGIILLQKNDNQKR